MPADARKVTPEDLLPDAGPDPEDVAADGHDTRIRLKWLAEALGQLSPRERTEWKKAFTPIHNQLEGMFGKSMIEAIHRETESLGTKP